MKDETPLHPLSVGLPASQTGERPVTRDPELRAENEALRILYESLLDFGQDNRLPVEKLDFVKARVFDTTVRLNRLNRLTNLKADT